MSSDQDGTDDVPLEVVGFCPSPRDDLWLVEVQSYQLIVTDTDGLGGADSLAEWLATTTTTFRLGVDFLRWPLLGWIHTRTTHDGEVSDHLHPVGPSDLEDDEHDIQTVIWAHGRPFNTTLRKASPRVNLSQRDRRVVMHAHRSPMAFGRLDG